MDPLVQPDTKRLLAQARAGDLDSLGALLERHRSYLRMLACTRINAHLQTRANPSDLVQETFLQACHHFDQFRGNTPGELLGWLRSIFVNSLARVVEKQLLAQKRSARREVSLEQYRVRLERSSASFDLALVSQCSSPSARAEQRELAAQVANQLARLPVNPGAER